jgi:hypothetical protein
MTTSVFDAETDVDPQGGDSYPDPRRATRMSAHGREIKMLRPICKTCEDTAGGTKFMRSGWWNDCTHDPYIGYSELQVKENVYETDDDGRKILTGQKTVVHPRGKPNWVSISQDAGINSGRGPDWALRRGFIFPQQLRSELFPRGIKRRCNFRECYQEDLRHYDGVGWFCSPEEAALVMASDGEETIITVPLGRKAEKQQKKQMQEFVTTVKALA